jgi:hypothetical protein
MAYSETLLMEGMVDTEEEREPDDDHPVQLDRMRVLASWERQVASQLHGRSELVQMTRSISYQNHYPTVETRHKPLFPNGVVLEGFIDIPDILLTVWRNRLADKGITQEGSDEAGEELENLLKEVPLVRLGEVSIAGKKCSDSNIVLDCRVDGTKADPSVAYQVNYIGGCNEIPPTGEDIQVSYSYSLIHNVFSYSFIALSGLTDGMTAHLSFAPRRLKANLRYILPFYWGKEEKLFSQPQEGEVNLRVNAMLLAGYGLLCSWYPRDVKLSKLKNDDWLVNESVIT